MRKPMMAGNWKMNKTPAESVALADAIRASVGGVSAVECVVCPTFVSLAGVCKALEGSDIRVGAQNVHWADSGAYTGEISAPMLKGLTDYVIIGHSERREFFGDTDEHVNKKVLAALKHELKVILCVGETLAQMEGHLTEEIVGYQVAAALSDVADSQMANVVVAYEPIWAIGTGRAATAEQAQTVCCDTVRRALAGLFGQDIANTVRILYGGSTNPKNIAEIMQQPDIDGALIGGASLKAEDYVAMVNATLSVYA